MAQETFRASVQYGDMKGTASADRHDRFDMQKYLEENKLIHPSEVVLAVSMWSGEVHKRTQEETVFISVDVTDHDGYENIKAAIDSGNPLRVRRIRFDMHLHEFFGLFKRFAICISANGLIDGREIIYTE